jgi:hypothetical protein
MGNNINIPMFYQQYTLLKDTPMTCAGTTIKWDLWRSVYTSKYEVTGTNPKEELFTKEQVENLNEWFQPIGDPSPFYDKFPDNLSEHMYFGELRHNQMCRFCTIAQDILNSDEYETEVTKIFKRLYEDKLRTLINKD